MAVFKDFELKEKQLYSGVSDSRLESNLANSANFEFS